MLSSFRPTGWSTRRCLATAASNHPFMWRVAHGMFDSDTPMTFALPGIEKPEETAAPHRGPVMITKLENGVRVASQDLGGSVVSLGLFVGAGSRHETRYTAGSTHVLEHAAFKGSSFRSKFRMIRDIERTGALFSAAASRDTVSFACETLPANVPEAMAIIAESAIAPAIAVSNENDADWDAAFSEIRDHVAQIKGELRQFASDPSGNVSEAIHAAAFHGNTLGLPLVADERRLSHITPASIAEFLSATITPERLVVAGVNIAHDDLVMQANKALGALEAGGVSPVVPSEYTGGSICIPGDGPGHFAIGFKGVSWADDDLIPTCVLHTLLGGGGSFSSGGPGKGMYTRLYTEILNRREWVSSAVSFNHCYADNGIFGIHASCVDPANLNSLIEVVTSQVAKLADPLGSEELERAKNMTKSSLIMNLESRGVVCEDIGRQILGSGKYVGPDELVKAIEAVREDDIRRVGRRILSSKPSIVLHGESHATQTFESISDSIQAHAQISV